MGLRLQHSAAQAAAVDTHADIAVHAHPAAGDKANGYEPFGYCAAGGKRRL